MSDAWLPGAGHCRSAADGGPLKGGVPRVVWQALGTDPRSLSARSAAQRLEQLGRASHLVWNPLNGEIVQLLPIVRAARSLGCPEGLAQTCLPPPEEAGRIAGPADLAATWARSMLAAVNTEGRLCVQICVLAFAWEPFTSGPMAGLDAIMGWLDSWGVPRQWPAGRPAPWPTGQPAPWPAGGQAPWRGGQPGPVSCGHAADRSRRLWAKGGHFGASQVPGWSAAGPGEVDVELLTGPYVAHVADPPRSRCLHRGRADSSRRTSQRRAGLGWGDG